LQKLWLLREIKITVDSKEASQFSTHTIGKTPHQATPQMKNPNHVCFSTMGWGHNLLGCCSVRI